MSLRTEARRAKVGLQTVAKRRFSLTSAASPGEKEGAGGRRREACVSATPHKFVIHFRMVHSRGTRSVRVSVSVRLSPGTPELRRTETRRMERAGRGTFSLALPSWGNNYDIIQNNQRAVPVVLKPQPPLLSLSSDSPRTHSKNGGFTPGHGSSTLRLRSCTQVPRAPLLG